MRRLIEPIHARRGQMSIDAIRAAETAADAGYFAQAADCIEWALQDTKLQLVLSKRVGAVIGADLVFDPGVGESRVRIEDEWWSAVPEKELSRALRWAVLLGIGVGQLEWVESRWGLTPRFTAYSPRFYQHPQTTLRHILIGRGVKEEITPGAGSVVLLTPYGSWRSVAWAPWRGVVRLVLLKAYALEDWGRAGEVASRLVVHAPPDVVQGSAESRRRLVEEISEMGADGAIVLPPGWEASLLQLSASSVDVYQKQIEMVDTALAVSLLGTNLTTEIQGGSFAAAQAAIEAELSLIRADVQELSTALRDQILVHWEVARGGSADAAWWPRWVLRAHGEERARAETLRLQLDAISSSPQAAAIVDIPELLRRAGIPLRQGASLSQYSQREVEHSHTSRDPHTVQLARRASVMRYALAGQSLVDDLIVEGVHDEEEITDILDDADDWDSARERVIEWLRDTGLQTVQARATALEQALIRSYLIGRDAGMHGESSTGEQ